MNYSVAVKMLLVVVIVLQSLTAFASATPQNHAIDIEHLQTQHDHQSDTTIADISANSQDHDINDCHHCGHCNGHHLTWILVDTVDDTAQLFTRSISAYQQHHTQQFLNTILRPPIA
ncbi:hypothetical protein [Shewanella gaetbuli]